MTSPHIDALALEGAVYQRAYAPNFWTLPSHASLFTGLYPSQAGATSETLQLPLSNTTVAEALKKAGYDTAAFVCNPWVSTERGFAQGFSEFHEMWRSVNQSEASQKFGRPEWATLKKVLGWLDRRNEAPNPFFLFININCVHLPYQPPEPFLSRFVGNRGYNNEEVNRVAAITSMWSHLAGELKLSERDYGILSDLYDGEVAFADECVGQIVEQVRDSGILDDSVVIVTSDHGENLGEHGLIDHHLSMYETTLHIPLMIRYPRAFRAGSRVNDFVSIVVIAPTIMDLCDIGNGMEKLTHTETSLALNDRQDRAFVVAGNERPLTGIGLMRERYPKFDSNSIDYRMRAIRTDTYKLIWKIDRDTELFDLQADPGELNNLANLKVETKNKLHKILIDWMNQIASASDISFLESQDKESLEILRSLGYME
jgi:arylsulfatase A-like enzyme